MSSADSSKMSIYAVRTTSGQERTVTNLVAVKVGLKKAPVASILAPEVIDGYIFVEAAGPHFVDDLIAGLRHARNRTRGVISVDTIEHFLVTKPVIQDLNVGDFVEVIGGPFRGLKAKVSAVDRIKQEVTIELLEEGFATLPVTVHSDYVKPTSKGGRDRGGRK